MMIATVLLNNMKELIIIKISIDVAGSEIETLQHQYECI